MENYYFNVTEERGEPPVSEWDSLPSIVESGFFEVAGLAGYLSGEGNLFLFGLCNKKISAFSERSTEKGTRNCLAWNVFIGLFIK